MNVHPDTLAATRSKSAGFTLVELMVTLVIFAMVAAAVTVILVTSARSKQSTSGRIESEQSARAALDLIARDLRSSGYGTDQDYASPQPAIAYIDSTEVIMAENQLPYPDGPAGPTAPLAYNPAGSPNPHPLVSTTYTPPVRYRTGAELIRYTLDVNNDGAVNASDVSNAIGADAAATPNPDDYVLVRQVYGDSSANSAGNNGGVAERVALLRKPGGTVPALFTVYLRGSNTAWNWNNGPVPAAQLQDIQRVVLNVTAAATRPDARGRYPMTTLKSEVNATRSVPDFGAPTYTVSGYVYSDANRNRTQDGGETGISGTTVRLGNYTAYTSASGFYLLRAPAGTYTLRHTPAMGYGSFSSPDTFNLTVSNAAIARSFADTARSGGTIVARAFNDTNTDGVWDSGETALQGIRFTVSPGSTTGLTDALGSVTLFAGVGDYTLTCNKPDSLTMSASTPSPVAGVMTNGGSVSRTFGLNRQSIGQVSGRVFVDSNRNGILDGAEVGMSSIWVGVSKDAGINVAGYAYTDATGSYDITVPVNDPPRTEAYSVYTIPPAGYFPTATTAIGSLWITSGSVLSSKNFGMANFQVITLTASRVLSLTAADLIEKDWSGNQTQNARADKDLILGADAGSTDNVSVWFNQYSSSPLFNTTPTNPYGYSRLAPNSVMAMVADTLDKNGTKARMDLVTGTRYATAGNFFVWFTQGTSNNEGYYPTSFSPGQNYKTLDNGDVQAVATLDCGGGAMPDIIVGTKGATAGQGSIEVWLNNDATTPTFTRDETFTVAGGSVIGEVTGLTMADIDLDGDKDMVVVTRTTGYNGQLFVFENVGRIAGARFLLRYSDVFSGDAPTSVAVFDSEGDGDNDIFIGTERSTSQGRIYQYNNRISAVFDIRSARFADARGIVLSLNAGDFGGSASRLDLAVGYRTSTAGYGGGVSIYYMDLGGITSAGVDPSGGSVVNMVPALTSANFNYGLNTTAPPSPYFTDLASGVKASATTGALVVYIR